MDPSRTPSSPGGTGSNKRRRIADSPPPASIDAPTGPAGGPSQQSQTSLPSIRQLHPFLPPTSLPPSLPQASGGNEGHSGYAYSTAPPPFSSTHMDPSASSSSHAMTSIAQREQMMYGFHESEPDDLDQHSPPKKKRRRQALSCTECKRRKIKCDRVQPCTPCTRRGEEAGCQWHIIEPVEKYVTRQEFDELKARFDQLQALVQRITSSNVPYFPGMGVTGPIPEGSNPGYPSPSGGPGAAGGGGGGLAGYPTTAVMASSGIAHASPQAYLAASSHVESASSGGPGTVANRYIKPEEPGGPLAGGRHGHGHGHGHVLTGGGSSGGGAGPGTLPPGSGSLGTSGGPSSTISGGPGGSSGISTRRIDNSPTVSSAVGIKNSALSLSSITSPYHPQQQKNYHAQTLILGERLRPIVPSEDPQIIIDPTLLLLAWVSILLSTLLKCTLSTAPWRAAVAARRHRDPCPVLPLLPCHRSRLCPPIQQAILPARLAV